MAVSLTTYGKADLHNANTSNLGLNYMQLKCFKGYALFIYRGEKKKKLEKAGKTIP